MRVAAREGRAETAGGVGVPLGCVPGPANRTTSAVRRRTRPAGRSPWSQFLAKPSDSFDVRASSDYRPSASTSTRAAAVSTGLVEDVVVVGPKSFRVENVDPTDARTLRVEACVLEALPAPSFDAAGAYAAAGGATAARRRGELPTRLEWFVFPDGECRLRFRRARPRPRAHAFALFAADGAPLRGVALRFYERCARPTDAARGPTLWVPVAVCLLSRLPIVPALVAWLEQAAAVLSDGARGRAALLAAAVQLADEVPRPVAGVLAVRVAGPAQQLVHVREHDAPGALRPRTFAGARAAARRNKIADGSLRNLPRPTGGGASLWLAALLLGPDGFATALACVLLERAVILHSDSVAVLTPVADALVALIYPLEWAHVYLPVVPRPLLELLDAPAAFVLGVRTQWFEEEPDLAIAQGTVLFDLDRGTVREHSALVVSDEQRAVPELPPAFLADVQRAVSDLRAVASAQVEAACSSQAGPRSTRTKPHDRANSKDNDLVKAEAALQLVCARHVCALTRLDVASLRRTGTKAERELFLVDRLAADESVRPFVHQLVETQHFQQLVDHDEREALALARSGAPPRASAPPDADGAPDADDAFCYRMPPPMCKAAGDASGAEALGRRTGGGPAPPPAEPPDASLWRLDAILAGGAAAATRVYRYGALADLLGVPVDELWAKLNLQPAAHGAPQLDEAPPPPGPARSASDPQPRRHFDAPGGT
ncbi:AEX-3 domain-containing protein [Pelagophyceae sp. CCMP2097]|nr:AEX-3 domain-containing protein [Pelagophyceae sp. CCMP2097]